KCRNALSGRGSTQGWTLTAEIFTPSTMLVMTFQRAPLHLHPRAHELRRDGAEGFVLCLPGGGYEHRSDHEGPGIAEFLATHGIAAGHLDYSVAPARYPQALTEVLLALADLRSGEHGDFTGPIAVIGFSAGGHLAGSAATATES